MTNAEMMIKNLGIGDLTIGDPFEVVLATKTSDLDMIDLLERDFFDSLKANDEADMLAVLQRADDHGILEESGLQTWYDLYREQTVTGCRDGWCKGCSPF